MKNTVQAIILAAGKSTRFNTEKTKLAELICGQPMILFSTRLLQSLEIETAVVVGHEQETIQNIITPYHGDTITYAEQKQQLGTGHALACSQHLWNKENILIINADMPLVTESIITDLYTKHQENDATVSFVSSCTTDKAVNKAYGRIVTKNNKIEIVEAKDFVGDPSEFCCINAGIYLIKREFLINYITMLKNNNASNEFYITDLIKIASDNNKQVIKVSAPFDAIRGINTLEELLAAEKIKQSELINYWMNNGVRFSSTHSIHIDLDVTIGQGSFIGEGVHLLGKTSIGRNNKIEQFSSLENAHLDDNIKIFPFCIIKNSSIASGTLVGPFAHLKNNDSVEAHSIIGSFVEMKNNMVGKSTQIKHPEKKSLLKKDHSPHDLHSHFSFIGARLVHHDIPSDEQ